MPDSNNFSPVITGNLSAVIANGASLSGAVDLSGTVIVGYIMPSSWTNADITFQASINGTNFFDLYDQLGNEIKHKAGAGNYIAFPPAEFASVRFLKIRSGAAASAVTQGAERQIRLVTRAV